MNKRGWNLAWAAVTFVAFSAPAAAQTPFEFKLLAGQSLYYETKQATTIETSDGREKSRTAVTVRQLKRWDITDVDAFGEATLELSIVKLSLEQTDPGGAVVKFDSENPGASHPDLVAQLGKLIGKPVLVVRLTKQGLVKSSKNLTDQESFARELPFLVVVPEEFPKVGLQWRRNFAIPLEPPVGQGQAYQAIQQCRIDVLTDDELTIEYDTAIVDELKSAEEKIPLLQNLPKGKVTLDRKRGCLRHATTTIDQKVEGLGVVGAYFHFKSTYSETLVESPPQQADRRAP